MVQINFASREVNCKLVFYGPGRCGKTTNLQVVHAKAPQNSTGELVSIATETDRTLYFDFLPLDLGTVAGMRTKFQLYTVPGQVYYDATRKLVLQGCDGVVFVADSNPDLMAENIESLDNLAKNLSENGLDIMDLPLVLQFNKRDLPNAMSVDEMNVKLNRNNWPTVEAVAVNGDGVFQTLKLISQSVIKRLNREHGGNERPARSVPAAAKGPTPAPNVAPPPPPPPMAAPPPPPPPRPAAAAATMAPPAPPAPPPPPVMAPPPPAPAPVMESAPQGNWKTKTDVFRERMAEIKKASASQEARAVTGSKPLEPVATAPSAPPPAPAPAPAPAPVPVAADTTPKKKGCMGMLILAAGIVLAGAYTTVHWIL